MARRLIPTMLIFVVCTSVLAQGTDPTRPPFETGLAAQPGGTMYEPTTGLQSIIRRKAGKPAALINGILVELGDKVGEARLIRIGEDSVVLRGPQGIETLYLTPGVEKKAVRKGKR